MEGRYEFYGTTDKGNTSDKFWNLDKIDDNFYEASWGRCGKAPLGFKNYTYDEAAKAVKSKTRKGYQKV